MGDPSQGSEMRRRVIHCLQKDDRARSARCEYSLGANLNRVYLPSFVGD